MNRTARHLVGVATALVVALPGVASADRLGGSAATPLFSSRSTAAPVVPTVVMADAFITPGAVDGRAPESRGTASWISLRGNWTAADGQLSPPATGGGALANALVYPSGVSDAAVEVDVTAGDSAGIVLRSNGVASPVAQIRLLEIDLAPAPGGGGTVTVRARRGATATPLSSFGVAGLGSTVRLGVTVRADSLSVTVDGTSIGTYRLTGTDLTDFAAFTHHGVMAASDASTRFDDVLITDTL